MKVVILGEEGFIGHKLLVGLSNLMPGVYGTDARIDDMEDAHAAIMLGNQKPDVVINCIGRTGYPNIDWCENNKSDTLFANLAVPIMIANMCDQMSIRMIHIGTGCIYNDGVFAECDQPNFIKSYYSKTKYLCEQALLDFDVTQLRIRMPIDSMPSPRNLVTKLFAYPEVIDVINSVTVLDDLVHVVHKTLERPGMSGVYNVVNPSPVTHRQIIKTFEPYIGEFTGKFISLDGLKTIAGRSNCVLSTGRLSATGIHLRPTIAALEDCASKYK